MQNLDDSIESLLKEKGITDIDPEIENDLKQEMKSCLTDQINKAAIMKLSEEKAAELARLVDDPDFTSENITQFIEDAGVNLAEITADTLLTFRRNYLGTGA